MRSLLLAVICFVSLACCQGPAPVPFVAPSLSRSRVDETRGFLVRDMHLTPPYANSPQWNMEGNVVLASDKVYLTQNRKSQASFIQSRSTVTARDWEMVLHFRVNNPDGPPADGLVLWYTAASKGTGSAFGGPANFSGIGIVLDTYRNGPKYDIFPRISVIFNTGTAQFSGEDDGASLRLPNTKGCFASNLVLTNGGNYERRTFKLLARYVHETLDVYYAGYDSDYWTLCETYQGLHLPINYHIGMSAATGDLTSSHELISFRMYQLDTPTHFTSHAPPVPMYIGDTSTNSEATAVDGGESSVSTIWFLFKASFYASIVGIVLFCAYLGYTHLKQDGFRRKQRFY